MEHNPRRTDEPCRHDFFMECDNCRPKGRVMPDQECARKPVKHPSEANIHFHSMPRKIDALRVEDTVEALTKGDNRGRNHEALFHQLVDSYKKEEIDFDELVVIMQRVFRPIYGGDR